MTISEVYSFVDYLTRRCQETGRTDPVQKIDEAMHLGSSGLEILGAIRQILIDHSDEIGQIVEMPRLRNVVTYVAKAFGSA
jgi:hypothetical protein